MKVRTDTARIKVPEVVRPMPIEEAVGKMREEGKVQEMAAEGPTISWEEAEELTKERVEDS